MKSLKVRLELNNKQKTLALKHAGVSRHAWNWPNKLKTLVFDGITKQEINSNLKDCVSFL